MATEVTAQRAAAELLWRRRARQSLAAFAGGITIPGVPLREDEPDGPWRPVETGLATHHRLICDAIQRAIETGGRLMIFAPPGSAKSSYASVVAPAWAMGRRPGCRVILASYAATPAERQSRRCRAIAGSPEYRAVWGVGLREGSASVAEWELANDAGLLAVGILGAVTSARADVLVIDDPVAGREEADSETMRRKVRAAYEDDLLTRLKPGASVILIQTRWHLDDLAGSILPEDYAGESGPLRCRDGQVWEVLCLPAQAERADDPLGRRPGEYLWPEWFPPEHWAQYQSQPRTWASLYQQRPQPDTGGQFEAGWFRWYDTPPERLRIYGASDLAVTERSLDTHPDYSEHGVFGVDERGDLYVLDWWHGQTPPDVTLAAMLTLVERWRPVAWYSEAGVIRRATEPLLVSMMRERGTYVHVEYLPSTADKVARAAGFRGRASAGTVHLPRHAAWARRLLDQLCAFPFARHDDAVDVCSLIGRALDALATAPLAPKPHSPPPLPFTDAWFAARERQSAQAEAERARYYR